MSFFKMAWNNMKRNFTDYAAYFVSAVFAVMVFYIFTSIFYNEQFRELSEISRHLNVMFKVSAVIVAIFSVIFLWYSSNFFMKRRKQEIGIYSLLGMQKRQIGRMLFYENLLLGMLALLCGILLGTLFSKFFIMLLLNLMQVTFAVKFSFVTIAVIRTVEIFAIFFVIISLHGYSLVYRFKLINLFHAQQEGEKAPKASVIGGILAILLIGAGYYLALNCYEGSDLLIWALSVILLTVAGTYVLFNSLIIMLIKMVKKRLQFYYRGTNLISTSQILYRIKGNARTLATIAVLSAVTITAVGTTYSYFRSKDIVLKDNVPLSIQHRSDIDIDPTVEKLIAQHKEVRLVSADTLSLAKTKIQLLEKLVDGYIVSVNQYNEMAEHQNKQSITLRSDNECMLSDGFHTKENKNMLVGQGVKTITGNVEKELKIVAFTDQSIVNLLIPRRMLVVSEPVYKELSQYAESSLKLRGYMLDNARFSKALVEDLTKVVTEEYELVTYYEMFEWLFQSAGIFIFIGAFLGILFFLATGSIIYFKQLTEAYENRRRYSILRNIGVSNQEIKRSVSKQLLLIFGLPLLVGICHSGVALAVLQKLMNDMSIFWYVVATMGIYVVFYVAYYFFTVHSYLRVVEKGR